MLLHREPVHRHQQGHVLVSLCCYQIANAVAQARAEVLVSLCCYIYGFSHQITFFVVLVSLCCYMYCWCADGRLLKF